MMLLEIPGVEAFTKSLDGEVHALNFVYGEPEFNHLSVEEIVAFGFIKAAEVGKITAITCSPYYRALSLFKQFGKGSFASFLTNCQEVAFPLRTKEDKGKPVDNMRFCVPQARFTTSLTPIKILDQVRLADRYPHVAYGSHMKTLASSLSLYTPETLSLVESIYAIDFATFGYVKWDHALNMKSLQSVIEQNMVFVSAQPDEPYFHWQTQLYTYAFAKMGLQDRTIVLFAGTPSKSVLALEKNYRVFSYPDTRKTKRYIPSIRPHILQKFFAAFPHLGETVFYHDSDIIFTRLPKFEDMTSGAFVSNTISYIGAKYIQNCGRRYQKGHPKLKDDDLLEKMCQLMDIKIETVREKEKQSGGAQYLLRNLDVEFWSDVEDGCVKLYNFMTEYDKKNPVGHGIQKWCADMWAVLWTCWKRGENTIVHRDLDFSWATDKMPKYKRCSIFHLAGVTIGNKTGRFYKGQYKHKDPILEYTNNPELLKNLQQDSATYPYVELMIEYGRYKTVPPPKPPMQTKKNPAPVSLQTLAQPSPVPNAKHGPSPVPNAKTVVIAPATRQAQKALPHVEVPNKVTDRTLLVQGDSLEYIRSFLDPSYWMRLCF